MRQAILNGRSGADAELKYTQGGTAVVNLTIAVNEKRGDAWECHWFRVTLFSKMAELLAPRIKKGTELFIVGQLTSRSWNDKNGQRKDSVEVLANRVRICQGKDEQEYLQEEGGPEL